MAHFVETLKVYIVLFSMSEISKQFSLILKSVICKKKLVYQDPDLKYRVTSYTLPCVSGALKKVTCPVYSSVHCKSHFLQGTGKTRSCLSGQFVFPPQPCSPSSMIVDQCRILPFFLLGE